MNPLNLAILGCGSRGRTYTTIATALAPRYRITAAADVVPARVETLANATAAPAEVRRFHSAEEFFAAGKLADVLVIATQDPHHFDHAMAALAAGYDLLLEKPAAESLQRCEQIDATARALGRRIMLGFVLRYTPFYMAVKAAIDSGRLGQIITLRASEGVEPFHQAHSFVRGHWAKSAASTPMIVAKCCHDADLLCWLTGANPVTVTSLGDLTWFTAANAPAGATRRCTDGCPAAVDCPYDARLYLTNKRDWLGMVMDGAAHADEAAVLGFLQSSAWGRCVYRCDNDVVDHQTVVAELSGGITATLSMTAFDHGRTLEVHGTLGSLRGGVPYHAAGAPELWLRDHRSGTIEALTVAEPAAAGYAGHGGGDFGIVHALDTLIAGPQAVPPGLDGLAAHQLAFWAEESRLHHGMPRSAAGLAAR